MVKDSRGPVMCFTKTWGKAKLKWIKAQSSKSWTYLGPSFTAQSLRRPSILFSRALSLHLVLTPSSLLIFPEKPPFCGVDERWAMSRDVVRGSGELLVEPQERAKEVSGQLSFAIRSR